MIIIYHQQVVFTIFSNVPMYNVYIMYYTDGPVHNSLLMKYRHYTYGIIVSENVGVFVIIFSGLGYVPTRFESGLMRGGMKAPSITSGQVSTLPKSYAQTY